MRQSGAGRRFDGGRFILHGQGRVILRHFRLIDLLVMDSRAVSEDVAPTSPEGGRGRMAALYHAGALRLTFHTWSAECEGLGLRGANDAPSEDHVLTR